MFNTVMVAVDGSGHSRRAVDVAADLALHYEARLVVAHTLAHGRVPEDLAHMAEVEHLVEPGRAAGSVPAAVPAPGSPGDRSERLRFAIAEQITGEARDTARRLGVTETSIEILDGDAVEALLECARRLEVDLMVMGSRGLSDVKGLLMGSVSHKLCQLATCTCVTVK